MYFESANSTRFWGSSIAKKIVFLLGVWFFSSEISFADSNVRLVRIENKEEGSITVSFDEGKTWKPLGKVIKPNNGNVAETDDMGFTAADWAPIGGVAAAAVNAVHIKVDQRHHGVLFTLQPRDLLNKTEAEVKSYFSSVTSIYTDIPAGKGLFGPDAGPYLGNPVLIEKNSARTQLPQGYSPQIGDVLIVTSNPPEKKLVELHFKNHVHGLVYAVYGDKTVKVLGQVERPVSSVGRFGGSQYAEVGKVRANHPGVLCISTSPLGQIGGFQIIPSVHAREPCLTYAWGPVAAWLIVRPLLDRSQNLEGIAPLFMGHILPGSGNCEVRLGENPRWEPVPERIGKVEGGLSGVTEIRIRF